MEEPAGLHLSSFILEACSYIRLRSFFLERTHVSKMFFRHYISQHDAVEVSSLGLTGPIDKHSSTAYCVTTIASETQHMRHVSLIMGLNYLFLHSLSSALLVTLADGYLHSALPSTLTLYRAP